MLKFQISTVAGDVLTLAFDEAPEKLAADELLALCEAAGLRDDETVDGAFDVLADAMQRGRMTRRGLATTIAMAWIAHRRAGFDEGLDAFARLVAPATLTWLTDEDLAALTGGDGGPQRPSATRQRSKARAKK